MLGSEVVVEEFFVPDETRSSGQERDRPRRLALFDVHEREGGFFVDSD